MIKKRKVETNILLRHTQDCKSKGQVRLTVMGAAAFKPH